MSRITLKLVEAPDTKEKPQVKFVSNDPKTLAGFAREDFADIKDQAITFSKTAGLGTPSIDPRIEQALVDKYTQTKQTGKKPKFGIEVAIDKESYVLHGNKSSAAFIGGTFKSLDESAYGQKSRLNVSASEISYIEKDMVAQLRAKLDHEANGKPLPKVIIIDQDNLDQVEKIAQRLSSAKATITMGEGREEVTSGLTHRVNSKQVSHKNRH